MTAAPVPFPAGSRPHVDPPDAPGSRSRGDTTDRDRAVAARFRALMETLGLDLADPNLVDTPGRVARAYRFLLSGLDPSAEPELRTFPNTEGYSAPVTMSGIRFHSLCAHHFLPFFGTVRVSYVPGPRLVGLSKLARAVELFARRPQVQERLTEEIASFLDSRLQPAGVMIVVRARHFCMEMRGVRKAGARTTTTAVRGAFEDPRSLRKMLARAGG